jgi:hypothetical protein
MEKGLRQTLITISRDATEKRKKLSEQLTPEEIEYIREHPKHTESFNSEATELLKRLMACENDGKVRFKINSPNIDMFTFPLITSVSNLTLFQRGKYEKMIIYISHV